LYLRRVRIYYLWLIMAITIVTNTVHDHMRWYQRIVESSLLAIYIFQDGRLIYHNPRVQELTGYSSKELDNVSLEQLIHPGDLGELFRHTQQALQGDTTNLPIPYQFRIICKDGSVKWAEITPTLIELDGRPALLENAVDITERKRTEEALRESEEYVKTILDYVQSGIIVVDVETHKIVDANPSAIEMFGVPKEQVIGSSCHRYICPAEVGQCPITDLGQSGDNSERVLLKANGESVPILKTVIPIILSGRKHLLESFVDITEQKKSREQLERSFIELAETVSRAMSSRDPYTASHQRRVAELARLVGEKMGLDKDRLRGLYIGGLLHDIGKISTPESILSKPGQLAKEEWALIHAHAMRGYEILDGSRFPWPVAEMALHHHERLDGSGYPHGISSDKLSLEVRILGVCDVVEAMSSFRPYRPVRSKEEVLEEIKSGRGTKYDANVVDILLQIIESEEFEFGWEPETREATRIAAF